MLTDLLRFDVVDASGRRARVSDLAIDLLEADNPPVTSLFIETNGERKELNWGEVEAVDTDGRSIIVRDLGSASAADTRGDVLLNSEVQDSLILDLLGRRTTRVCDLMLEYDGRDLRLRAVDAGMGAMLRRVFRGRWFKPRPENMFDWKYVEFLRGDPSAVSNGAGYRLRINRLPAGEIARLADYVPYLHAAELLKLLPDEKAADVLEASSIDRQLQIIEEFDEKEAVKVLALMSPDLAADVIGRMELAAMQKFLSALPKKHRDRIVELLKFPEDTVGGAMTNEFISFAAQTTAGEAKERVQPLLEEVHFSSVVYVVDDEESGRLRGAVNLKDMLAAAETVVLEDIMDPYLQSLDPFRKADEAAYRIVSSQLPAMPVIDKEKRLIGIMTVEAAVSRLVPTTSSLQRLRVFS